MKTLLIGFVIVVIVVIATVIAVATDNSEVPDMIKHTDKGKD